MLDCRDNCLCASVVYHYNGEQWYEQFLQVGRLDWALILLGLALSESFENLLGYDTIW